MKTITVTSAAMKALKLSIKKWKGCVEDAKDGYKTGASPASCALCQAFNKRYNKNASDWEEEQRQVPFTPVGRGRCGGCPVRADTGKNFCGGSPYVEYENYDWWDADSNAELTALAQAELDYLKSLKKRCIVEKKS